LQTRLVTALGAKDRQFIVGELSGIHKDLDQVHKMDTRRAAALDDASLVLSRLPTREELLEEKVVNLSTQDADLVRRFTALKNDTASALNLEKQPLAMMLLAPRYASRYVSLWLANGYAGLTFIVTWLSTRLARL
jgi:hypothetical protein